MGREELTAYIGNFDFEITNDTPADIVCIVELVIQNYKNKFKMITQKMMSDYAMIETYKKNIDQASKTQFERTKNNLAGMMKRYGWSIGGLTQLWCLERYGVQYDKRYKHPTKL